MEKEKIISILWELWRYKDTDKYSESEIRTALESAISALSENKGDLISRQAVLDELEKWEWQELYLPIHFKQILDDVPSVENKGEWIPFSEELPPKGEKVHVSTFGIVTIGERTSEADKALRLSILEPMNNLYKNIDPKQYQITHWQPLPEPYKGVSEWMI